MPSTKRSANANALVGGRDVERAVHGAQRLPRFGGERDDSRLVARGVLLPPDRRDARSYARRARDRRTSRAVCVTTRPSQGSSTAGSFTVWIDPSARVKTSCRNVGQLGIETDRVRDDPRDPADVPPEQGRLRARVVGAQGFDQRNVVPPRTRPATLHPRPCWLRAKGSWVASRSDSSVPGRGLGGSLFVRWPCAGVRHISEIFSIVRGAPAKHRPQRRASHSVVTMSAVQRRRSRRRGPLPPRKLLQCRLRFGSPRPKARAGTLPKCRCAPTPRGLTEATPRVMAC